MIRSLSRRRGLTASVTALILVLVFASQTAGAQWSESVALSSIGERYADQLVVLDDEHIVATFQAEEYDHARQLIRRSLDGGRTWRPAVEIARWPNFASISGKGIRVDLVKEQSGRVYYQRSTNYGKTFSAPVAISPAGDVVAASGVVAGPDGLVGIWWHVRRGPTFVRFSSDGGQTFDSARRIGMPSGGHIADVALGDGIAYVAYQLSDFRLRLTRSSDLGMTWSAATNVSDEGLGASLTAEGDRAYVAFTAWGDQDDGARFMTAKLRGTSDRGSSWSAAANLARHGLDADLPLVVLDDGILHATYYRCTPTWDTCDDSRTLYRRSAAGSHLTEPVRISFPGATDAFPHGLGVGERRVFVLYTGCGMDGCGVYIRSAAAGR